jgi:hypothetical protein
VSDEIIAAVRQAKYFSVLCDETTDVSHQEQLCLCVRFVDLNDGHHRIREEFLQFQAVTDLSGEGLADTIMAALTGYGLDMKHMVGQGYDGAAAMSGCVNGVQAKVRQTAQLATYVHCASHVLNLVLNTACCVPEIRNMFGTVKEVTNFINESAKRREIALSVQDDDLQRCLVTLCETRFIEWHDALIVFAQLYGPTLDALDAIAQQSRDRKAADKAISLSRSMADPGFIVTLCSAEKVMAVTAVLSRSLQKINQDLFEAMESVGFVLKKLTNWRTVSDADDEVDPWENIDDGAFSVASQMAAASGIQLTTPRLAGRQTTRNNVQASNPADYYQRAVWYPYLDAIITSLTDKFSAHHLTVLKLVALVPSVVDQYDWKDVASAVRFYKSDCNLASEAEIRSEFEQWKDFCLRMSVQNRPQSPLHALDIVPQRYENIRSLLQIFCTLPVTTCTAERAFSAMKLLKTYLRNTMTDERLTGLALMYIHPEIDINPETVIDRFAAQPAKRKRTDCKNTSNNVTANLKRRRLNL